MNIKTSNSLNETLFTVNNKNNHTLRGIVHNPSASNQIGLILIPAGTKYRAGAHSINVKLARHLVNQGYTILRIDTEGLGYSDGEHFKGLTIDAWREVEAGKQIEDTLILAQAFKKKYQLSTLILGGICGAAVTAQYIPKASPQLLEGILAINPTISEIKKSKQIKQVSAATRKRDFHRYIQKILSPHAWKRFFLGKSSFKDIVASLFTTLKLKLKKDHMPIGINKRYWDGLQVSIKHRVKILFLFSGNDESWCDFQEYIMPKLPKKTASQHLHTVATIEHANHEIHLEEWQQETFQVITHWLNRAYNEQTE